MTDTEMLEIANGVVFEYLDITEHPKYKVILDSLFIANMIAEGIDRALIYAENKPERMCLDCGQVLDPGNPNAVCYDCRIQI